MDEIWYEWEGSSMWSGHNDETNTYGWNNDMENHMICMKLDINECHGQDCGWN